MGQGEGFLSGPPSPSKKGFKMTKNILTNMDMNGNQLNVDASKIVQSDGTSIEDVLQQHAFIFGG